MATKNTRNTKKDQTGTSCQAQEKVFSQARHRSIPYRILAFVPRPRVGKGFCAILGHGIGFSRTTGSGGARNGTFRAALRAFVTAKRDGDSGIGRRRWKTFTLPEADRPATALPC